MDNLAVRLDANAIESRLEVVPVSVEVEVAVPAR
jgi:hypothetical protein